MVTVCRWYSFGSARGCHPKRIPLYLLTLSLESNWNYSGVGRVYCTGWTRSNSFPTTSSISTLNEYFVTKNRRMTVTRIVLYSFNINFFVEELGVDLNESLAGSADRVLRHDGPWLLHNSRLRRKDTPLGLSKCIHTLKSGGFRFSDDGGHKSFWPESLWSLLLHHVQLGGCICVSGGFMLGHHFPPHCCYWVEESPKSPGYWCIQQNPKSTRSKLEAWLSHLLLWRPGSRQETSRL